jgi:tetratricopeptide (TPR) repeat protein
MASPDRASLPVSSTSDIALESKRLLDQAEELLRQGKLGESEAAFHNVIALSVQASQGFYGLGVIHTKRGDLVAAASDFEKCVGLDPLNANAYYFMGEIWGKRNLPDVAQGFFKKALEINPEHLAARQKSTPLDASHSFGETHGIASTLDPSHALDPGPHPDALAQGVVSSPPALSLGVYELISADQSPLAKQTVGLIDALNVVSVKPRLSAYAGSLIGRTVAAFVFLALALLTLIIVPLHLALLAVSVCLFVSIPVTVLRVKNTEYTIEKGRLKITTGVLSKEQQNIELYRVEDIELHQNLVNRLTGDGTLILDVAPGRGQKHVLRLRGLAKIDRLREIFDQMRNLILLMRTGTWGKGVIY